MFICTLISCLRAPCAGQLQIAAIFYSTERVKTLRRFFHLLLLSCISIRFPEEKALGSVKKLPLFYAILASREVYRWKTGCYCCFSCCHPLPVPKKNRSIWNWIPRRFIEATPKDFPGYTTRTIGLLIIGWRTNVRGWQKSYGICIMNLILGGNMPCSGVMKSNAQVLSIRPQRDEDVSSHPCLEEVQAWQAEGPNRLHLSVSGGNRVSHREHLHVLVTAKTNP